MLQIDEHKLKSGLSVMMVPMESQSVTVLTVIRAGSRDEEATQYGGAHFLEHFVFKGTKKYPEVNDISRAIDGIGGLQNAFTSTDYTGYWVKVDSEQLATGLEVVAQLVCEPLLPEEELHKEKGTIVEELRMYEDNYPSKALQVLEEMVFPESGLGRPIIGTEGSINAMKTSDLKAFRDRWYYAENMVVIVVGAIGQPQELLKQIEDQFSSVPGKKGKIVRTDLGQVFTQKQGLVKLTNKKTEQAHLALGLRTFETKDDRWYIAQVMNNILGGNMSSRLWTEVREKRGLAYYVKAFEDGHKDQGMIGVRAGIKLDKIEEAVKVIVGELEKVAVGGVTSAELVRGKASLIGRMKLDLEDSQEVAGLIADDWIMREGRARSLPEILEALQGVSEAEIKALAQELFDKKQYNLSIVGPLKDAAAFEKILE